jgi:hypothetical protein
MEQLGFFDPPRARSRDPETSQHSAARVDEFAAAHYALIWKALEMPGTIHELAERTSLDHVQVARRLPEMSRVRPTEERRPSPTGRPCRVWRRA